MTTAYDEIREALEEAIAHTKGEKTGVRVREVEIVDVAALRARLGMTQEQFAAAFGFPLGTLRNWEQHRREPEGPARVLLTVIERETEAVLRALRVNRGPLTAK